MDYIERNHNALIECMMLCKDRFSTFAIPFLSNHNYDIIGITFRYFFKIKIICTENKQPSGAYIANLLKSGGYESGKERKKHFDNTTCDFLFVWTPDDKYLIPSQNITQTRAVTLSVFEEFKIIGG